jgi:GntP family gluconate:H+ symporter
MFYGIIIAIPTVIIAGPVFGHFAMRWAEADPPRGLLEQFAGHREVENPPGRLTTIITVLLPVILMLLRTLADVTLDEDDTLRHWADFIGEPAIALLIGVIVAIFTFRAARGFDRGQINTMLTASLAPAASILLIIGAGGGFKQVLIDTFKTWSAMETIILVVGIVLVMLASLVV